MERQDSIAKIYDLLYDSIVEIGDNRDRRTSGFGTGFFVAPGLVLTCSHVVSACKNNMAVRWRGRSYSATIESAIPVHGGNREYHELPDLAVVRLSTVPDHPVAWLAGSEPVRGAVVHGVGYNTLAAPRMAGSSDTRNTSEVRLEVVGRDQDCWRVAHDACAPGMSGGPVLDIKSGRVVGLFKANIDGERYRTTGGWIIGVDLIEKFLPALVEANAAANPPGTEWRNLATRRSYFTKRLFGPINLNCGAEAPHQPPSWYLDPRNEVVNYVRPSEFDLLLSGWCLSVRPETPIVKLLHAPGGSGKTRFSLRLVAELEAKGWVAGVANDDRTIGTVLEGLPAALDAGHRIFVAVDYAEGAIKPVQDLLSRLAQLHAEPVRVLLLARSLGDWWKTFRPNSASFRLVDPQPIRLDDLAEEDVPGVLSEAYSTFRRSLRDEVDDASTTPPSWLFDSAGSHRRALDLHAAALAAALSDGETVLDLREPLEVVLAHERDYWRRAIRAQTGAEFPHVSRLSDRILVVPTLYPAANFPDAETTLSRVPRAKETLPCGTEELCRVLASLYPASDGQFWSPLVPDRLGETLVAEVVGSAPSREIAAEEMTQLLAKANFTQATHAITVLARVAGFVDATTESTDKTEKIVASIEAVMASAPDVYLAAVVAVSSMLSKPAPLAAIAQNAAKTASLAALEAASNQLPNFNAEMLTLAVEVESQRARRIRQAQEESDTAKNELRRPLASVLNSLAVRLASVRDRESALAAAQDATDLWRELATSGDEESSLALARALSSLGLRFAEVGRHEDALSVTKESVSICSRQAAVSPAVWLPELVMSLNNYGSHLAANGLRQEALLAVEEAAAVCCGLAATSPDLWLNDLIALLNNLGRLLADAELRNEALAVVTEAVRISREQANLYPAVWTPDLAVSLHHLGIRLASVGHLTEALSTAREAVAIRRRLVSANPAVWIADLAMSLNSLGIRLASVGDHREALTATEESIRIFRRIASVGDGARRELALSLVNLSNRLADVGRHTDASQAAEESLRLWQEVRNTDSTNRNDDAAIILGTLATRFAQAERFEDALRRVRDAVSINANWLNADPTQSLAIRGSLLLGLGNRLADAQWRDEALAVTEQAVCAFSRLAPLNRAAWLPDLAKCQTNLALRLYAVGRLDEALAAAIQAAIVGRELAESSWLGTQQYAYSLRNLAAILAATRHTTVPMRPPAIQSASREN